MELAVFSSNSVCVSKPKKFCINIHHINEHWVTSTYNPLTNTVNVYDSLTSGVRMKQIKQQLLILYGMSPNVRYVPIKQQGNQPLCGLFAIAAAFSVFLGLPPEAQDFDVPRMQAHLKMCLNQPKVIMFPTHKSLLGSYFQNQATVQKGMERRRQGNKEQSSGNKVSSDTKDVARSRKQYFKLYKQNQRLNLVFRSEERKKMHKAEKVNDH